MKYPWAKPVFYGAEKTYLMQALESSWISGGMFIDKFEADFKSYLKSKHCITTSNGTTALQLALLGLGIGPGDEVIVPGFTFVAPANMVIAVGATPVYADINPETWCIEPADVERCITKKTKAILPVHVYGNVCEMDALIAISKKHGLALVEDTAEAAFSRYLGKYAGTFGDIGCFSFQATKTITMGEGGCILTDNDDLYEKMRLIRDHGMRKGKRYWHDVVGFNFRLTNLQAAVGCGQLDNIKNIISDRKRVYDSYSRHLRSEEGITMQHFAPDVDPVVWAVAMKIEQKAFQGDRDFLMQRMMEAGVETRPGFYPISTMPLYRTSGLRVAEDVGLNVISLPSYPSLVENEIELICECLKKMRR